MHQGHLRVEFETCFRGSQLIYRTFWMKNSQKNHSVVEARTKKHIIQSIVYLHLPVHVQLTQKFFWTLMPQQSPPSLLQSSILFASSQNPSLIHSVFPPLPKFSINLLHSSSAYVASYIFQIRKINLLSHKLSVVLSLIIFLVASARINNIPWIHFIFWTLF